jgi:predicted transcriptional regulator
MNMKQELNDTNLLRYLGKSPELKILDFLIENRRTSWNITEIEQQGCIARSTLKAAIPKLLDLGLIKVERAIGRSRLFLVNAENPVVGSLMRISGQIDVLEAAKKGHAARKGVLTKKIAAVN